MYSVLPALSTSTEPSFAFIAVITTGAAPGVEVVAWGGAVVEPEAAGFAVDVPHAARPTTADTASRYFTRSTLTASPFSVWLRCGAPVEYGGRRSRVHPYGGAFAGDVEG